MPHKAPFAPILLIALFLEVASGWLLSEDIIINEIMYNPASGLSDEEYLELSNVGTTGVDLTGWHFTRGIDFVFPNVTMAPGSLLIVAADTTVFETTYGVTGAIGNWGGSLSNRGERLTLADASGSVMFDVSYADEGDWAERVAETDSEILQGESGWTWKADHDGHGESLELTSTALHAATDEGQLWQSSISGPTPGQVNSTLVTSFPPIITKVRHAPPVPTSSDSVTVSAKVVDADTTLTVTLRYRVSSMNPGSFQSVVMTDDGSSGDETADDGVYSTSLPAMADETIVEFYVEASDGTSSRTWPAPTDQGQVANCHYQVDNESHDESVPFYRVLMTVQDEEDYADFEKRSDAQVNSTLIVYDCEDTKIRYRCGVRIRGSSSRSRDPRPMRINLPHSRPLNGQTAMNLSQIKSYLQLLGAKVFQSAGLPSPKAWQVQFRRNGVNLTLDSADDKNFGSWVLIQPFGSEFLDDTFPNDSQGNLYRNGKWEYESDMRYDRQRWTPLTNSRTNDFSDVHTLLDVLVNAVGDTDYLTRLEAVADVDQWLRWLAVMALLANTETNLSTGDESDYASYVGVEDPRFKLLPHDLDTIITASGEDPTTFTLLDMIEFDSVSQPLVDLFALPEIRTRYFEAMHDLVQTTFSKAIFDALVEDELGNWASLSEREEIIEWMDERRQFATTTIATELNGTPPFPAPSANESVVSPPSSDLMISEFLAADGTFQEFIELANHGTSMIALSGMRLTDDLTDPDKYVFPEGLTIAPGEYRTFLASEGLDPSLYLGFGLDADGEAIYLINADGVSIIDEISFGSQIADMSVGRTGALHDEWRLTTPTPGVANVARSVGMPSQLTINEWLVQTELDYTEDFAELYNSSAQPIALGGIQLLIDPWTQSPAYQFPQLSFLAPNAWRILLGGGSIDSRKKLPFNLKAHYGWLSLIGSNGIEIDEVHWSCQKPDVSVGRNPDGTSNTEILPLATPGRSNSDAMLDLLAIRNHLRVVAIHYDPAEGTEYEYIELANVGTEPIDLKDLQLSNGVEFDFPAITLGPGERVFVAENRVQFETVHGLNTPLAGQYSGKLSNGGERLRLDLKPIGFRVLEFEYDDAWYPGTDGNGDYLQVVDPNASASSWSEASQWQAATPSVTDPYALWVQAALGTLDANVASRLADPDEDSIGNLAEWGFALNPDEPNSDGLPRFVEINPSTRLIYQRNLNAPGLTFTLLESVNMIDWFESEDVVDVSAGTNGNMDHRELTSGHGADTRVFLRIAVREGS